MTANTWALILAAGDGNRLRRLTTDREGVVVPKQFCSLDGEPSLLGLALERAGRVVPESRIAGVVATGHRRWWRSELSVLSPGNVIEQPANRGTAVGILLPLLYILARDPKARILLLPSDHFVADEITLARVMQRAIGAMESGPCNLYLLGITPDEPDSEFGWIVPARQDRPSIYTVDRFVEKPTPAVAAELMRQGGVWNSFIIAARGAVLLSMFVNRMPGVVAELRAAIRVGSHDAGTTTALSAAYRDLQTFDFCRDVLQGEESGLRVIPVPRCGWSDLGTPERVASCLGRRRPDAVRDQASRATHPGRYPSAGSPSPVLSANLAQVVAAGISGVTAAGRRPRCV